MIPLPPMEKGEIKRHENLFGVITLDTSDEVLKTKRDKIKPM